MIFESIKTLLGDELTAQVETALKGKGKDGKDVDLVVGNDGTFVPADKYEGEKRRATSAENALKKAAEAVKDLGGSGDPTKLEEDAGKAKTTIETLKTSTRRKSPASGRTRPSAWRCLVRSMTPLTLSACWTRPRSRSVRTVL